MVRVRKVAGGRTNIRGIGHYEVGDEDDVSPADAEYLVEERGDFEYVDEPSDEVQEAEDVEAEDESEAEDSSEAEADADESEDEETEEPSDEGDYEERTAAAEALADEHWQHTVSAVEDGEADDYLDILEQVDDRNSVQDAIEERREALEG